MKHIALVYMSAGMSSRFLGKIKQFAQITDNETLIEYSLKQSLPAGFTKIIFIVGEKTELPFKEKFKDNFKGIPVYYAKQTFNKKERDKPWGTSDALCSAEHLLDCAFVICNGDDLYGENSFKILFNHLKNSKNNEEDKDATLGFKLINTFYNNTPQNRGIFSIENGYVQDLEEVYGIDKTDFKATNTNSNDLCSMNIFALHPKTIKLIKNQLETFKKEHQGDRKAECLLPNEIPKLIHQGKLKLRIYATDEKTLGITCPEDEAILREILKKENQTNIN